MKIVDSIFSDNIAPKHQPYLCHTIWMQYRYDKTFQTRFINLLQGGHICPLPGDHLPGLDCLPDEQVLPLLMAMDSDTLLQVGKMSARLYCLVLDRHVWRHLLKGVELDKEQVEVLAVFGRGLFGIQGSPEMMSDILKEAAERFTFLTGEVKVIIEIQSSVNAGDLEVFEVDIRYLEELVSIAESVGARFNIKDVEVPGFDINTTDFPKLMTAVMQFFENMKEKRKVSRSLLRLRLAIQLMDRCCYLCNNHLNE